MDDIIESKEPNETVESEESVDMKQSLMELNKNLVKQNEYLSQLLEKEVAKEKEKPKVETILPEHKRHSRVIAEEALKDIRIKVIEKDITFTGGNIPLAQDIYYAQQLGLKLRHVEADLNGGSLALDGDKYRSSSGDVKFSHISLGGKNLIQGLIRKNNHDDFFWPALTGYGTAQMKDTVRYIHMVRCVNPRRFVLENGIYLASAGNFQFGVQADMKLRSMMLSQKNMLQTSIEGQGILLLELPVPPSELEYCKVQPGRPVRVNGQQVLYREGNVKRDVRLASTVFGSVASGAGFVEEYTGEGMVVLAPTLDLFEVLAKDLGEHALDDTASQTFKSGLSNWLTNKTNRGYKENYKKNDDI